MPLFADLPVNARVLFIRLRNLGEAVLDTANLCALKRWRPDLQITTLVEGIYTDLYPDDGEIEAMALVRAGQDKRSPLLARLRMFREIRRRGFDAVINLHGGPASAQMTALSGARYRVGAGHFRNRLAYNLRIPPAETILGRDDLHTVESQFAWFRWLGLPDVAPGATELRVTAGMRDAAGEKLRAAGVDPAKPYAVLAPTNEFYTKRWDPVRYADIAGQLAARGWQIALSGAPTDEQRTQLAEVQAAGRAWPALSSLRIGELTAMIAGAGLFVGNDSGPAHIAAAVRTPLVVMFGPASSVRWRPWTPRPADQARTRLAQNYFPCNPCSMYRCDAFPEPECIKSITVSQVMRAIEEVTEKKSEV
ncbi:MAG: glycosyltransferase family 9 protein [Blastocatellia bacterium]